MKFSSLFTSKPKKLTTVKTTRSGRLVPFTIRLSRITDPDELEREISKLTDEQYQIYKDNIMRERYKLDNIGFYLREKFDEMKVGDYRRQFILEIVERFKLQI